MYNKERKVWNFLRKLGKYTFILCGGASFLCGLFLTGGVAAVLGLTSLTGLVLNAGANYILEIINHCERCQNYKPEIPDEMKCSANSKSNEDMNNVKIYSVSPMDMGVDKGYVQEKSEDFILEEVFNMEDGPSLKLKM